MCGICGIFNFGDRAPADRDKLRRAADALAHRGPDDEGFHFDRELALANRRLSVIDVPGGHQPLANEDESLWITFNGEIYNYRELRVALTSRGHRFRTKSDTEVILHLYEDRGAGCIDALHGMFAFALWDRRERRLFLARDRLGIKPLFYWASAKGLAFASELRALRLLAPKPFESNSQAMYDFFTFRYVPSPHTVYQGVLKLPAGHYLLVDSVGPKLKRYWDVPAAEEASMPPDDLAHRALECLREAVRLRLIADVPLGVFLSGGTDSGAIVSLMSELEARPLRTFSVGFEERGYSELPWARQTAKRFATEHAELIMRPEDVASHLPHLISIRQEPVAEPTDVALYLLSSFAARSVKVVLAGEGGDELFAGYPKYAAEALAPLVSHIPAVLTRKAARLLPARGRRLRLALETLAIRDEAERLATWFASFSRRDSAQLFAPEFLAQIDPAHPVRVLAETLHQDSRRSRLKRMLYADIKIWLPDNLLLRGDQMTMAASIEERVPFLDHRLVELAATIPDRLLVRGLETKRFMRMMLQGRLPPETFRRPKVGFAVPISPWLRRPLKSMAGDLLLSSQSLKQGYFNVAAAQQLVKEHLSGRRDHRKQLWALINFELWQRLKGGN